ncbi:lipase family protein [Gordonia hongkongensis]|uniref:lipase family protein n=1 Tax=Gordonia hongkongensis TaxID=1701090 RepID=UPI001FF720E4|nr:lipase family protein [Gordonia hongkongensis]UPG69213.1 alpha/beta hydrolase [Gordonia hongkongensis]
MIGVVRRHPLLVAVPFALVSNLVVLLVLVAGIRISKVALESDDAPVPFTATEGPGKVVSAERVGTLPLSARLDDVSAIRVEYWSTDAGTGKPTVVSGLIVTGPEPEAGQTRPVVAFAHGTTGIDQPCAPSVADGMYGLGVLAHNLVKAGFVVALPDYQGLGARGVHPYLDARTAGRNVIDSVRALRAVLPYASDTWAAYGGSQGGGAVLAAAMIAPQYGAETGLVGAAAMVPAADVVGLVEKSRAGTMTRDQQLMLQWVLEAWSRSDGSVRLDDYRRGAAVGAWDTLSACTGPATARRAAAAGTLGPGDIGPGTDASATTLAARLTRYAVPVARTPVPMYVLYGGTDTFIDAEWTASFIERACAVGDSVTVDHQPDRGHADVDAVAMLPWILDRFAGEPVPSGCHGR